MRSLCQRCDPRPLLWTRGTPLLLARGERIRELMGSVTTSRTWSLKDHDCKDNGSVPVDPLRPDVQEALAEEASKSVGSGGHPFNPPIRVCRIEEPGMPGLELGPERAVEHASVVNISLAVPVLSRGASPRPISYAGKTHSHGNVFARRPPKVASVPAPTCDVPS